MSYLISVGKNINKARVIVLLSYKMRESPNPGMRNIYTDIASQLGGQGEGAMDPTIGFKHLLRYSVYDALDGVTKVLLARLEYTRHDQEDECELIVKSEGGVVNQASLEEDC